MRSIKVLVSAIFITISAIAAAQTSRPAQCAVWKPASLDKSVIKESDIDAASRSPYGQKMDPPQKKYWYAYSDRANNTTYDSPKKNAKPYKALSFNQKVTIAQIKDDYALVIDDPKIDVWPNVSASATVLGWIKMSNLLLWDSCPANEYGIYNKAVICANADAQTIKNANVIGKLFMNPNEAPSGKLKTDMKFFFVMKEEGSKALLSNEYTLDGGISYMKLYGWVDKASYVPWNQRSCLEPTWDLSDAEYLAANKTKARVYRDNTLNVDGKLVEIAYNKVESESGAFDPFMYRLDPYLLRYPILDGGTSDLYYCSAFATPSGKAVTGPKAGNAEQYEKLNKILDARRKVNIGIVIDGTQSMAPFFQPVIDAIGEGCKYFADKQVKVGVVIFRDVEDGNYCTEVFPMTNPTNPQLTAFLQKGGVYGVKSAPKDKDMKEALYAGMDKALTEFKFKPEESNILLVVGDCGDNGKSKIDAQSIASRLVEGNVSVMGFQVRNKTDNAFQDFNSQIIDAMIGATQGRYDRDSQESNTHSNVKVRAKEVKGGYDLQGNNGVNLYIGMYRNADIGKEMPAVELRSLMENSFNVWNQSILAINDMLIQVGSGTTTLFDYSDDQLVNSQVEANKAAIIAMIGQDTFDALNETNSMLSFKGWTPKKDKSSKRDFYKPVVFISSAELESLIFQLGPVYKVARTKSSSRTEYVKAVQALVRSLLPGITQDEINKKGYNEVMRLISGLNESTAALAGPSIQDIADPNVVDQGTYISLVNAMVKKYQGLLKIQSSDYKYVREFDNVKYYWLPMEDLP